MGLSIQDYAEKINSRLSWTDILSLAVTALFVGLLTGFLFYEKRAQSQPITYTSANGVVQGATTDNRPFASIHGTTYTYSWCGNSHISDKNKIYFANEAEALASGRKLSKLCK